MKAHRAMRGSVILLACLLAATASAAPVGLGFEAKSGPGGGSVEIPVVADGAVGLGAIQFDVVYDAAVLELTAVAAGGLLPGAMLDWNVVEPGRARLAAAMSQAVTQAGGPLVILTFTVMDGDDTTVPLSLHEVLAWEYERSLEMSVAPRAGSFTRTGTSVLLWVAAAAALVLVAVAVAFVARRRSSTKADPAPPESASHRGSTIQAEGFCPHCGKPVEAGSRFCRACGGALG